MTSELAVVAAQSFQAPVLIERAGPSTKKKFFEFFTVPIRNANTRAAYYRAIQQFLAWAERAGYQDLEDIEPITVAAYIETLQRQAAAPTVKQHMAAIRMLFSWFTEKGVLAMNPAREVKTERFSRTEGKTPAFVEGEVQKLLDVIEPTTHTGLRDRALLERKHRMASGLRLGLAKRESKSAIPESVPPVATRPGTAARAGFGPRPKGCVPLARSCAKVLARVGSLVTEDFRRALDEDRLQA